ncbi:hypothetical protein Daus18300_007510 [Diaporthe australafricana]|uniref:Uncharacterized protein n=1 Tax=Diaporthe australafricana TaxID=127596 RepID=A0ABR3WM61_9PEZI
MIHGAVAGNHGKSATLLVYELKFLSRRGTRIKEADILFEFKKASDTSLGPQVSEIRPDGVFKMEETLQNEASNQSLSFNVGPDMPGVDAGMNLSREQSKSKEKKYYTTIVGENPPDLDFGYHTQARFRLEENKSQETGIPSAITVAILLEREDDEDFVMLPHIEVTPNFKFTTLITSLTSSRSTDDPIFFSVREPLLNDLTPSVSIDENKLELVNLDDLWDCTLFNSYGRAIKKR